MTYIKYSLAAGLSMVAGAQTVHQLYRPLEDLEEWVKKFEEQQKLIAEVKGTENQANSEPTESQSEPTATQSELTATQIPPPVSN